MTMITGRIKRASHQPLARMAPYDAVLIEYMPRTGRPRLSPAALHHHVAWHGSSDARQGPGPCSRRHFWPRPPWGPGFVLLLFALSHGGLLERIRKHGRGRYSVAASEIIFHTPKCLQRAVLLLYHSLMHGRQPATPTLRLICDKFRSTRSTAMKGPCQEGPPVATGIQRCRRSLLLQPHLSLVLRQLSGWPQPQTPAHLLPRGWRFGPLIRFHPDIRLLRTPHDNAASTVDEAEIGGHPSSE